MSDKVKHPVFWTVFLSIVSLAWVYPIVLVLINSFKQKAYISRNAFSLPTGKASWDWRTTSEASSART